MKNIEIELNALIGKEGGYTNNPKDSGGETNWGITKAVAEAFGYSGAMRDLTKEQAKEIYRKRYWIQPRFDQIFAISPEIAFELFDTGVNMGTSIAGKFLQRSLNVLNSENTLYPDMVVDGSIGAMTIAALNKFVSVRSTGGIAVLLKMLNALQSVRYIEISEAAIKNEVFLYGWQANRID